mmetsp:Transcript_37792/g.112809  ORF Transcript_37792/g.112809 Transcript_37792/m.112809 type:complete len:208 (+) Transcript_37792:1156-1779(+)
MARRCGNLRRACCGLLRADPVKPHTQASADCANLDVVEGVCGGLHKGLHLRELVIRRQVHDSQRPAVLRAEAGHGGPREVEDHRGVLAAVEGDEEAVRPQQTQRGIQDLEPLGNAPLPLMAPLRSTQDHFPEPLGCQVCRGLDCGGSGRAGSTRCRGRTPAPELRPPPARANQACGEQIVEVAPPAMRRCTCRRRSVPDSLPRCWKL